MAIEKPTQRASLRNAELRLVLLLEDLERTVHSAEQLANAGLEEEAILVIDLQRDALARLPEQIASEMASPSRRPVRRIVLTAAAALLTVAASVAAAVSVVGPQTAPADEVIGYLDTAGTATDPAARLQSIESALEALKDVPKADPVRGRLAERIASEARKASDEVNSGQHGDHGLITRARNLADRAEESAPPPPSNSQSPLEDILPEA